MQEIWSNNTGSLLWFLVIFWRFSRIIPAHIAEIMVPMQQIALEEYWIVTTDYQGKGIVFPLNLCWRRFIVPWGWFSFCNDQYVHASYGLVLCTLVILINISLTSALPSIHDRETHISLLKARKGSRFVGILYHTTEPLLTHRRWCSMGFTCEHLIKKCHQRRP